MVVRVGVHWGEGDEDCVLKNPVGQVVGERVLSALPVWVWERVVIGAEIDAFSETDAAREALCATLSEGEDESKAVCDGLLVVLPLPETLEV